MNDLLEKQVLDMMQSISKLESIKKEMKDPLIQLVEAYMRMSYHIGTKTPS